MDAKLYQKPKEYDWTKQLVTEGQPVYCYGPAGCGKSELFRQVGADLKRKVYEISGHTEIRPEDFLGYNTAEAGKITWSDGLLPRAAREGSIIIVNEVSSVSPGILFVLHHILEEGGKLVLTENANEEIKPKKGFCLVCTDNTAGIGDSDGLYAGTNVMNQAFLDRFSATVKMDYLPSAIEQKAIKARFGDSVDKDDVKAFVQLASKVRAANAKGKANVLFSTRRLMMFVDNIVRFKKLKMDGRAAFALALDLSVLNKVEKADAGTVKSLAQKILNIDLDTGEELSE